MTPMQTGGASAQSCPPLTAEKPAIDGATEREGAAPTA